MKLFMRTTCMALGWALCLSTAQIRPAQASPVDSIMLARINASLQLLLAKAGEAVGLARKTVESTLRTAKAVEDTKQPRTDWDAGIQAPQGLFAGLGEDGPFAGVPIAESASSTHVRASRRQPFFKRASQGLESGLKGIASHDLGEPARLFVRRQTPALGRQGSALASFDSSYDVVLQRLARQANYAQQNGDALVRNLNRGGLSAFALSAYQARSAALTAAASLQSAAQAHQSAVLRAQEHARASANAKTEVEEHAREIEGQRWPAPSQDGGPRRGRVQLFSPTREVTHGYR